MTVTTDRESIWLIDPVSSKIKIIPVIGARTTAVKNPAMASRMKLLIYSPGIPNNSLHTVPKTQPAKAPNTSIGKKMPPGTPAPKLTAENTNRRANKINNV